MTVAPAGQTFIIGNGAVAQEKGFFGKALSGIATITKVVVVGAVVFAAGATVTEWAVNSEILSPVVDGITEFFHNMMGHLKSFAQGLGFDFSTASTYDAEAARATVATGTGIVGALAAVKTAVVGLFAKGAALMASSPDIIAGIAPSTLAQQQNLAQQASIAQSQQSAIDTGNLNAIDQNAAALVQKHHASTAAGNMNDLPDASSLSDAQQASASSKTMATNSKLSKLQQAHEHEAEHAQSTRNEKRSHRARVSADRDSNVSDIEAKLREWKENRQPQGKHTERVDAERAASAATETTIM